MVFQKVLLLEKIQWQLILEQRHTLFGINGWLIKKYTSTREIKDIVICDNLAGIIYKDKIELVNI